jgi:hypothetical protein
LGRTPFFRVAVLVALLAGFAIPAQACALYHPPPTREQAAAAQEPRFGLVGRILTAYIHEETKRSDTTIVQVEVTKDFSGKLPPVIFVFNPGGGACVGIDREHGKEVITIVKRGVDGLFYLAY